MSAHRVIKMDNIRKIGAQDSKKVWVNNFVIE